MCSISLSFYAKHKSMNETSAKQAPLSQVEASYFSHCLPAFDEETDMDGNNNPDNGNDSPDNNNYFSDEDEENNQMQHLVASCCTPVACKKWFHSVPHVVAIHTVLIVVVVMVIALLASMLPSRGWHFASLFFYAVPPTSQLNKALVNVCPLQQDDLCLSNDDWRVLSNGLLSKYNERDMRVVAHGVSVGAQGGLIVNVMARDVADAIPSLIDNVEALKHFFPLMSVVVFENDSVDGTRGMFQDWKQSADGYTVDLMTCEEEGSVDCRLGHVHRYDKQGDKESAIGRMARYRNMIMDYILKNYSDSEFSHMLVLDLDLAISLAPLGLLYSLGSKPHAPTITRGLMMVPGALGTLYTPYDFSAFRPIINDDNRYLRSWHDWFCELAPPGTRWRNNCDVMSPFNQMHMFALDTEYLSEPFPVASSFHGATIYPLKQIRKTGARYDDGSDGQRCEHIGFNFMVIDEELWPDDDKDTLNFENTMYVTPKWTTHLDPTRPGGPTGQRFRNIVLKGGLNAQCAFLYTMTILIHLALNTVVALMIGGLVFCWDKFVKTDVFRRFAVATGVNVADVLPGGLDFRSRKDTGDGMSITEALALGENGHGNGDSDDDDEEVGLLNRRGGAFL